MSRRNRLTDEERIAAVQEYINVEGSYRSIAKKYGISIQRFRMIVGRAQTECICRPQNRTCTGVQPHTAGL